MLVDVIRMRDKGLKLSKAQLGECIPTRGDLTVTDRFDAHNAKKISIATLVNNKTEYVLPVLDFVLLTKLRGNAFVLIGIEEVAHRKQVCNYPQSWWVRPAREIDHDDGREDELEAVMVDAAQWDYAT